jgi:hypothetical protein
VWLDPNRSAVKVLPPPPPITIQTVAADDKNYETVSSLTLPAHTSSVQINYAAVSLSEPEAIRFRYKLQEISGLSLTIPERVKFRYRLKGLNHGWADAGVRRQAFFTNLAPGRYAFEVLACNNDGVWTSTPAVWRFVILPAYYQTLWFKAALWTTAVMLLWLFYLYRLRQISAEIHGRFNDPIRGDVKKKILPLPLREGTDGGLHPAESQFRRGCGLAAYSGQARQLAVCTRQFHDAMVVRRLRFWKLRKQTGWL